MKKMTTTLAVALLLSSQALIAQTVTRQVPAPPEPPAPPAFTQNEELTPPEPPAPPAITQIEELVPPPPPPPPPAPKATQKKFRLQGQLPPKPASPPKPPAPPEAPVEI